MPPETIWAKQFKRMNGRIKFLHTRLGRIIRDIGRKTGCDAALQEVFAVQVQIRARQIRSQSPRQRGWKLYSWHAPETECIGKGKAYVLRVRRQGLAHHHQQTLPGRTVHPARQGASRQSI
ncbi:unnamed protein product [Phaeothamnion confervicola]